jgi:hypothetical protein
LPSLFFATAVEEHGPAEGAPVRVLGQDGESTALLVIDARH